MLSQKPFQVFDVIDHGEEFREVFGDKSVVFQAAERFEQTVPATAGISQALPLNDYTDEEMDRILDINLKAVFVCSRAAARLMEASGGGVILNTSSVVSLYGQPSGCLYPTTKFAVNGLTKSLSRELAPRGIRVNAVAPGVTRTDMVANLPEAMIKPLVARIPIGRVGEPDEVADAFLFLASDMASYITGAVLPVDGGVII